MSGTSKANAKTPRRESSQGGAPSRPPRSPWLILLAIAAGVFVVATVGAAVKETPTIDEFAHVPAGLLHWRHGQLQMYRNNPPLGKMWVALPLALDSSVVAAPYQGPGTHWDPWRYGTQFEQQQGQRYLALMSRARLMTIPLALVTAWLIYVWGRQLFGEMPACVSAALFLLSPTVLAHGHLATVDVASTATFFGAVFALRWRGQAPSWRRDAVAGGALGLALAVKFSALILVPVAPALLLMQYWPQAGEKLAWKDLVKHAGVYVLFAWLALNLSMGFSGTFDTLGSLKFASKPMLAVSERLPAGLPLLLPRAYVTGIDALQYDVETGDFIGYLHGQWSRQGWKRYYLVAYAIKELEIVVVLTVLSLVAVFFAGLDWRELVTLWLPPALFLFVAAVLNSLCLGIRYVLPMFPFLFLMLGSSFALAERWLSAGNGADDQFDRRWWLAGPLVSYAVALALWTFPAYLSYFNLFVGGPENGAAWLVDSNLDWGQDLYRLPEVGRRLGVDRWRLMYFGHVDPKLYGIEHELPSARPAPPEMGVYAVSTNYWKAMPYAMLSADGEPLYQLDRVAWMAPLVPSEQAGSIMIFDLRATALERSDAAATHFNLGMIHMARNEQEAAAERLAAAVERAPDSAKAHYYLGIVQQSLGKYAEAIASLRAALRERPDWDEALNNLAWCLAATPSTELRDPAEAVMLAERACQLSQRQNLSQLDTLVTAYIAAGRNADAADVCREAIELADKGKLPQAAEAFRKILSTLPASEAR